MKRIMTALNNPNLNEQLKIKANIEIVGKDIQYKEAVIDLLKLEKNIDFLIINEKIPGEITLIELVKEIYKIKKDIKVIVILEKENNYLERKLKENKVKSVYYNNKISLNELIEIIEVKEIDEKEELKLEIKRLKEILNKQSKHNNKDLVIEKVINKIINKKKNNNKKEKNKKTKTLLFTGNNNIETIKEILIFREFLNNQGFKVLLISLSSDDDIFKFIFKKNIIKKRIKQTVKKRMKKFLGSIEDDVIKIYYHKNQTIDNLTYINTKLSHLINNKTNNINKIIKTIILENKEEVDYILINLDKKNILSTKKIETINYNYIYIIQESRIVDIKINNQLLEFFNDKKKIRIIVNNYNKYSINIKIIRRLLKEVSSIYKVNYNPIYNTILNNNNGIKILRKKYIEKEYKKIIKEVIK